MTVKILKDWMLNYLKSRDAMTQSIQKIEETENSMTIHKAAGKISYIIAPEFIWTASIKERKDEQIAIVTYNTKKNVELMIVNWNELSNYPKLCIYFVNPKTNEKWMIYPHTHNQITEKTALKRGIEAMFSETTPYL